MKNFFSIGIAICFVAGVALSLTAEAKPKPVPNLESPTQEAMTQDPLSDAIEVSVKGDRLVFSSIADYKRTVDEPSDETKEQFARTVAALGFTSFAQRQNPSLTLQTNSGELSSIVQDEYFASILNPDLVVQIGEHIFRVNPTTERVYALPVANEEEFADLIAENTLNSHLQSFSTEDNVLELIQAKTPGTSLRFCTQSGIGGLGQSTPLAPLSEHTVSADFIRYGLFFTLQATVSHWTSSGFPYYFEFTGGVAANLGAVYYHVRCGSTANYVIKTPGSWKLTYQKFQSYQGSTNLNEVYFMFRLTDSTGRVNLPYIGFRRNH